MSQELPSKEEFDVVEKYEQEIERIQKTLGHFLDADNAREVAGEIYDIALDIDDSIEALLKEPRVLEKYNYDGEFFTSKDGHVFAKAYNGLSFLRFVVNNQNLENFLREYEIKKIGKTQAINYMLKWFRENFALLAKARLLNWKEGGDLRLVSKEVLREAIKGAKSEGGTARKKEIRPLTPGEQDFFKLYEEEMGVPEGEVDKWLREKIEEKQK